MVHGWVRARRRLEWLAGTSDPRVTLRVWLATAVAGEGISPALAESLRVGGVDLGRLRTIDNDLDKIADPIARLGIELSYPDWIVRRALASYGADGGRALLVAMNQRAPLTARANRLKVDREQLAKHLDEVGVPSSKTRLASDGLILDTHENVYSLVPFREGELELMDEGSQLVAELVAPPPRGVVIDACAGAGGKTLALGAMLGNKGRLLALDVTEAKLEELRLRARRAGLTNVTARIVEEGREPAPAGSADRVLVDAPCTGLGVIRRNPETRWRVKESEPAEMAVLQRSILERYAPLAKVGGRVIYATCSLLAEENDAVVDGFLADHKDYEEVPLKEVLGKERALAVGDGTRLRTLPHVHDCDGFFAAILRRKS